MRLVSVAKKSLRSSEQPAIVFVPAHSLAGTESGEDLIFVSPQRSRCVESRCKKCRTIQIRQHKSMFGWQKVLVGGRVEQHISPGDLSVKPLSHRALIGAGA